MSRPIKLVVLIIVLIANVAVLWWRNEYGHREVAGLGPALAELGKSQVDAVTAWRNAASVPLTASGIRGFVDDMPWSNCGPLPAGTKPIAADQLSDEERRNLQGTVAELLEIYGRSDPAALYDFMLLHSEGMPPAMIESLKRLLVNGSHGASLSLEERGPRELFLMIADQINYQSRWESLVSGSGCVTLWEVGATSTTSQNTPLGANSVGMFRNQTRFHQLFATRADGHALTSGPQTSTVFADVQCVVQHDTELQSEPSPYFIRFVLDRSTCSWQPTEMIHVPTISGSSPMLLF